MIQSPVLQQFGNFKNCYNPAAFAVTDWLSEFWLVGLYKWGKRGMQMQEQDVELKEKKKKYELENKLKKKSDKGAEEARDEKKKKFKALF